MTETTNTNEHANEAYSVLTAGFIKTNLNFKYQNNGVFILSN